jgi:transposase
MDTFTRFVNSNTKSKFNWLEVLQLMIAERLNEPSSKLSTYNNQSEYLGLTEKYELQYFYRTLDLLSKNQEFLKQHLFKQQQNLFTQELDVVFYDVTTLYFESQEEVPENKRQKGYSKDGKAHKTQVVLGLLVDKMRNPITYNIYKGNTYEGGTMIDALSQLKKTHNIDKVIAVADSAMIDSGNRAFMEESSISYIIGDRLKNLPENVQQQLLNRDTHKALNQRTSKDEFSYVCIEHKGRKIICTYSAKRAKKDACEREKLINKANEWLANPSKYKQVKKKGAGRFISIDEAGTPIQLDNEKITQDSKYDGFKALSTTSDLSIEEVLEKYRDLFEVEHAFRTLKSQLEIRPIYHWTNKRIEGHIAMCFIAYTFLNYLRNVTQLQYRDIIKTLDQMQMSIIEEGQTKERIYMRSALTDNSKYLCDKLNLVVPKDTIPQKTVNQIFNQ